MLTPLWSSVGLRTVKPPITADMGSDWRLISVLYQFVRVYRFATYSEHYSSTCHLDNLVILANQFRRILEFSTQPISQVILIYPKYFLMLI